MSNRFVWRWASLVVVAVVFLLGAERLVAMSADDQPLETGPNVVVLRELEDVYVPVPFDHLGHAKMAQMWNGCVTCHHRPPHPTAQLDTGTTTTLATEVPAHSQADSAEIPACKSCHPIAATEANIQMPSLKGAYHRQCLNCHQEWMHENACVICHQPKDEVKTRTEAPPAPGDIVGRMHPPIPEPDDVLYKTRFTPADGGNVLFRHKEHTADFGIRCAACHQSDNCSHCHGSTGDTTALKPVHTGMTWDDSHKPCMACHQEDRCQHCHFHDGQEAPPRFSHAKTGQSLDADHAQIACAACHADLDFKVTPTCGDAACHKNGRVEYPAQLPGPKGGSTPTQAIDSTDETGS